MQRFTRQPEMTGEIPARRAEDQRRADIILPCGQIACSLAGREPDQQYCPFIETAYRLRKQESPAKYSPVEQELAKMTCVAEIGIQLERIETQKAIEQSHIDSATGVRNIDGLVAFLENIVYLDKGKLIKPYHVSIMFIDLDNFKSINSRYGHPGGNRVLKAVAYQLEESCRSKTTDAVGRVGGDEYAIIMTDDKLMIVDDLELERRKKEILQAIEEHPVKIDGRTLANVGASIGYAAIPDEELRIFAAIENPAEKARYLNETIIKTANKRMFQEKEQRKTAA